MTMNNKILTVSYGTFSCTLEGFDDSFGTMKAIAEYFRDLAADDRYFGAEPPVPDAEMLTRIAEREISRRVEARHHDGRIVLSAADAAEEEPLQNAEAHPEADALPAATPIAAAVVAATVAEASAVDEAETETPDTEEVTVENIAAALEEDPVQAEVQEVAEEENAVLELTDADMAPAPEFVQEEAEVETAEDDDPSLSEAEAFFAASEDQVTDEFEEDSEEAVEAEAPEAPAEDTIAAKLQRIRAVVSQSHYDDEEDELFEDEHAEDLPSEGGVNTPSEEIAADEHETSEGIVAEAARDIEEAFDIDDAETVAEETEAQEQDELSALLARFDGGDANEVEAPEETAIAKVDDAEDQDMGLDTLAALMAADKEPDDATGAGENLFDGAEADEEEDVAAEMDESVEAEADDAETEEAPRRARVFKVKRADIDAALASGQLEQVEDEAPEEETASTLSDHEEAELQAELAQVEAEFTADDNDAGETDVNANAAETDVLEDDAEPAIAAESKSLDVQDDDVTRLMAEAENQMEEPEGTNRRDAFAHLKAAVQAKKADSGIGKDSIKDEGAFRSDLAEVVKPRRPEVGTSRAERPGTARPAPLKLVAEQRVDVDAAPKGPVRPRRIAAAQEVTQDGQSADSFADYAADLGANDLPALLEAAASYLSFVEGQDQFSRPQLMKKVRQIEKEDFSREDSLRSFGQLLRSGKIEKISGGRFAVTSDIGYRPEQRAAG
ncbi:MAG: hypothetical protein ABJ263_15920 [Tateyamaria sp.]|uniref:hypothetical protein n=1 Tax=Tateyamaria sp. TaxID=1929288 RepID=UPI00328D2BAA